MMFATSINFTVCSKLFNTSTHIVLPCFKFNFKRRTMMLLCGNLFYLAPGHLKPSVTKKKNKQKTVFNYSFGASQTLFL